MLSCKETSFIASKRLDGKLTCFEKIGFWLHISMCGLCRAYARDIKKIQMLMLDARKIRQTGLFKPKKLSEQSRKRIKQVFDKALHKGE
jgi:hypothetical protein